MGVQSLNAAISLAAMNAPAPAALTDRETRDKPGCGDGMSMFDGALYDISSKRSGRGSGMRGKPCR